MTVIAVDDEKLALEGLVDAIREAVPEAEVYAFQDGLDALAFTGETPCDVVFLDIRLRGLNGIEVAKRMKLASPKANIVFTTGYSDYRGEAFDLHASGYIMKPVTPEKIRQEVEDLRYPPVSSGFPAHRDGKRLCIRAFDDFEAYWDGEPLQFHYNKTKELLAYLIDRKGALCTNRQIIDVLWEDTGGGVKASYFQNLRNDLRDRLRSLGCEDVLIRQPGKQGIRPERVDCDYYDWLNEKASGINAFRGEYMSQYSWAEYTLGLLETERMERSE